MHHINGVKNGKEINNNFQDSMLSVICLKKKQKNMLFLVSRNCHCFLNSLLLPNSETINNQSFVIRSNLNGLENHINDVKIYVFILSVIISYLYLYQ